MLEVRVRVTGDALYMLLFFYNRIQDYRFTFCAFSCRCKRESSVELRIDIGAELTIRQFTMMIAENGKVENNHERLS